MKKIIVAMLLCDGFVVMGCGEKKSRRSGMNFIYVTQQYGTITEALRNARTGAIVEVGAGVYNEANGEQFPLFVPHGVTLRSGDFGKSATGIGETVVDMDSAIPHSVLNIENDTAIEGLTLRSTSGQAPYAVEVNGFSNVTVRNCNIEMRTGLMINGCTNVTIEGNTFFPRPDPSVPGASMRNAITVSGAQDVVIRKNTMSSFQDNIAIATSVNVVIEENIVIRGGTGIAIDVGSLATSNIGNNDVWGNVINFNNTSTQTPFLPTTGANISADPQFMDREGGGWLSFVIWGSSPCATAGKNGETIGARPYFTPTASPTITKSPQASAVLQVNSSAEILRIVMTNNGSAETLFGDGLRIWVRINSNKAVGVVTMYDAQGVIVGAGQNVGGLAVVTINKDFPHVLTPSDQKEFWFGADTSGFVARDYIETQVTAMEWMYGKGWKVNDGITPFGLPITHTAVVR